jgi:hypothetical protein
METNENIRRYGKKTMESLFRPPQLPPEVACKRKMKGYGIFQ